MDLTIKLRLHLLVQELLVQTPLRNPLLVVLDRTHVVRYDRIDLRGLITLLDPLEEWEDFQSKCKPLIIVGDFLSWKKNGMYVYTLLLLLDFNYPNMPKNVKK
jgi:hypothetical protein